MQQLDVTITCCFSDEATDEDRRTLVEHLERGVQPPTADGPFDLSKPVGWVSRVAVNGTTVECKPLEEMLRELSA